MLYFTYHKIKSTILAYSNKLYFFSLKNSDNSCKPYKSGLNFFMDRLILLKQRVLYLHSSSSKLQIIKNIKKQNDENISVLII